MKLHGIDPTEELTFEDVMQGVHSMQKMKRQRMTNADMIDWIPPFLRAVCSPEHKQNVEDFLSVFARVDWDW